ncbi:MAG: hypothetical protein NTY53_12740, partial [Kiritimatiellaeota bacterium]|nr:hypothetical protein [Kiritimatiellota bacterium]
MTGLFQTLEKIPGDFSRPWKKDGPVFPGLGIPTRCAVGTKRWKPARVLLLAVALSASLARAATGGGVVKEITVERHGGGTIESGSVLAYVGTKVGEELSRTGITRDVKNLQKSGRFSYVESRVEEIPSGYRLSFGVEPKLRIRKLEITGAEFMGDKKVRELLELGSGDIADDATIAAHAVKVYDKYNKKYYPNPKLTWKITPVPGSEVADVLITVAEGASATVKEINF